MPFHAVRNLPSGWSTRKGRARDARSVGYARENATATLRASAAAHHRRPLQACQQKAYNPLRAAARCSRLQVGLLPSDRPAVAAQILNQRAHALIATQHAAPRVLFRRDGNLLDGVLR